MRTPVHADAVSAARVIYGLAPELRAWVLARMLREAGLAADHVRRGKGAHPQWGDGGLMATALRRLPPPEPSLSDNDYCRCLAQVYSALAEPSLWRSSHR